MGVITKLVGISDLAREIRETAEVFTENKSAGAVMEHDAFKSSLEQYKAESTKQSTGVVDSLFDGLNRLPRPALALGTLGLFAYAMYDPLEFSKRMEGLQLVPDQLWWLLGAIVSFYFGARELHYMRSNRPTNSAAPMVKEQLKALEKQQNRQKANQNKTSFVQGGSLDKYAPWYNQAIEDWKALQI